MTWEIALTAILLLAGWLWWDGLNKRELAIRAARVVCQRTCVQLLDETVSLKKMRLQRNAKQQARLLREFVFEYSDTGDNRLPGHVYLLGSEVTEVNLFLPATPQANTDH